MFWLLTIFSQLFLGFELSFSFLNHNYGLFSIIALSIPIGFCFSSLLFFFLSTILGQNLFHLFIHLGIILFISLFLFQNHLRRKIYWKLFKGITYKDFIIPLIYLILSSIIVFKTYLRYPRSFPMVIDSFIHEDLSLQSSFLVGINSPRVNIFYIYHPNYSGIPSVSRWLVPFHSVMLRIGKSNLRIALCIPTSLILFSFFLSMNLIGENLGLPYYINFLSPFIGILTSGFGFFRFLIAIKRNHRLNDYVSDLGDGRASRFHPILNMLLGNRSNSYSISIIAALFLALTKMIKNIYKFDKYSLIFIGFITGFILPALSHQAFISISIYLLIFSSIHSIRTLNIKDLSLLTTFFFIGSSIHIPRMLNSSFLSGIMGIEAPWSRLYKRGVLFPAVDFWVGTYGIFPFILLIGFFLLNKFERQLFLPSICCFFLFTFWKLQPNCEYNSVPILLVFMSLGGIIYLIIMYRFILIPKTLEAKGATAAIVLIITLISITSSLLGLQRQWKHQKQLWDDMDERLADWLIKKTDKKSIFLSPQIPLQPVSTLAGRQCYLESLDVLRNIGINPDERMDFFKNLIKNNTIFGIENYISYFVKANELKFDTHDFNIEEDKWNDIYSTRVYIVYEKSKI